MPPTHFACVMIYRMNPATGEFEFLVVDTVSTHSTTGQKSEKQTKFPGGMNRIPGEPIDMTGRRETLEETYLAFTRFGKIWERQIGANHAKHGFLVRFEDCRGELRKDVLVDNGDEMSPPYWEAVSTLKYKLFAGHQPPLLAAMEYLGI
ncbi:MAG: hypothetical protein Q8Q92_04250 [bacterium]|nr:hypothetical protein [bacterium]